MTSREAAGDHPEVADTWDPDRYLMYADERGRPFHELLARVAAATPRTVADLGCGPGNLTALLSRRWPHAEVLGVDSSPGMVARAQADHTGPRLRFELGDLRTWLSPEPLDVLVSNAALQWVPGHLGLLPRLVEATRGWLAFQVPGNFDQPTHTIRRRLARDPRFSAYLRDVAEPDAFGPDTYLERLVDLGCEVDAWETTYLHVLRGEDAVLTWVSATGARPTLQALPEPLRADFVTEYRAGLDRAYPPRAGGTVMPFRRVFVVARVTDP